jgi:hypothetical protein
VSRTVARRPSVARRSRTRSSERLQVVGFVGHDEILIVEAEGIGEELLDHGVLAPHADVLGHLTAALGLVEQVLPVVLTNG